MINFFLNRRVLTNLLTFLIVGVGLWQFAHVRREAFPEITFDIVSITTLYPGASPDEVEQLVTKPIEERLKRVNNIDRVESYSIEGRSMIIIRLEDGLRSREVSRAVTDIQQSVSQTQDLPDEATAPTVEEMTSDRPLINLSVAGGEDFARDAFAEHLKDQIETIPGISTIDLEGDRAKEIWVEVNPNQLMRYRLTVGEVAQALHAENINLSAGSIETGTQDLLVRTLGAFQTAEDVANVILRGNDGRGYVRVKDIARVKETFTDSKILARAGGMPAITLKIRKNRKGDTIKLADTIKAFKAEHDAEALQKGMKLVLSEDISFFIKRRLNVMKSNLFQGGFLILIALFTFLDWRLALVAALGVPISFAAVFAVAVPFGFTINLMTLLAFIIVLGMLDDDSVVVAENIYRHLEMGKGHLKAAIDGTREVILPVLGSVAATAAAFIPFAIVKGIMGKFLFMIPVVIILSFIASVLEAFFILPAHVIDILPFGKPVEEKNDARWYVALVGNYKRALGWCVRHRYSFVFLAVTVLLVTLGIGRFRLKMIMFPPGHIDQFFIQIETPEGSSLTSTKKAVEQAEQIVLKLPNEDLDAVTATVGQTGYEETVRLGTQYGQLHVFLTPEDTRAHATKNIIDELRPQLEKIPGLSKVTIEEMHYGPPVGRAVQARIRGNDIKILKEIADQMKAALASMPGTKDIKDNSEGGKTELRIKTNSAEAAYAGVTNAQIARHILYAFEGGEATKIRRANEEVVVKVKLAPEFRSQTGSVEGLLVLNNRGQQINLGPLVRLERHQSAPFIEHFDYKRTIEVTADVDNVRLTSYEANARLEKLFSDVSKRYPGYEIIYGGEEERTRESMDSLRNGFIVAIFLDVIILATLFNSYIQPFIILLTIPIGLVGVAWALMLHGKPASFMALLGAVAMTGVVVNNAIVLVDFINKRRKEGDPIQDAVIEAGATRLRPIMASSITTLLGLFPTAYGIGGYEPFVAPICLTLAWGLALAMPMTLFVIPMATLIANDADQWLGRLKNKFWRLLPTRNR